MSITPIDVELSYSEMTYGALVGAMRQTQALDEGLQNVGGRVSDTQQWGIHMVGALGELAAAKALGVYFDATVGTFKTAPDLDGMGGLEVRTRSRHDWDLIVRPNDDDDARLLLVTGRGPDFKVWGWAYARDAQRDEWLKGHGGRSPAWFMPSSHLRPLSELGHV